MKNSLSTKVLGKRVGGPGEGEDPSYKKGLPLPPGKTYVLYYTFMKAIMSSETSSAKMA